MQEQWPRVKLVYVPANVTAVARPLDRTFVRPLKACVARLAAEHFAGILVAECSCHGLARPSPKLLRGDISAAWKNLIPTPEVLASAQAAPRCRRTVQERQRPSAA